MSAFSFTAPFITEEEEVAERQALPVTERERIHGDVYGKLPANSAAGFMPEPLLLSDDKLTEKVNELRQVLQLLVSNEGRADNRQGEGENSNNDTDAASYPRNIPDATTTTTTTRFYRQAREVAADVVDAETDLVAFLRVHQEEDDYDVGQAAQRIDRYWQLRTELFGEERAYRPLTLADGMQPEANLMALGLAWVLPQPDQHGRAVLFIDRTRFTQRVATREAFLRVLFYMLFQITKLEPPMFRPGEFVVILNVKVSEKMITFVLPIWILAVLFTFLDWHSSHCTNWSSVILHSISKHPTGL